MASRRRAWSDTRFNGAVLSDEAVSISDLLFDAPTSDTLTVVRILVDLQLSHIVTQAADAANVVDIGIGVSSTEAAAIGPSALPEPAVSTNYPPRGWLYAATKEVRFVVDTESTTAHFQADLTAMRKVDKGFLFLFIQQVGVTLSASLTITGRVRVLCMT